jgi:hypothetical protein
LNAAFAAARQQAVVARRRIKLRMSQSHLDQTDVDTFLEKMRRKAVTQCIHMIVPGGGISLDGSRWISSAQDYLLSVPVLSQNVPWQDAGAAESRTWAGPTAVLRPVYRTRRLWRHALFDAYRVGRLAYDPMELAWRDPQQRITARKQPRRRPSNQPSLPQQHQQPW